MYTPPSGLSLKHYKTIAEREDMNIVFLTKDNDIIQEGDVLHWGAKIPIDAIERIADSDTAWTTIFTNSSFIGSTRKEALPRHINVVLRMVPKT